MQIHKGNQYNKKEKEGENSTSKHNVRNMSHTGQLNTQAYKEKMDMSRNRTSSKHKCKNQTQNQETIIITKRRR